MGRAEIVSFQKAGPDPLQKPGTASGKGHGSNSFGDGLAAGARAVIADARSSLANRALSDAEAVHEVRKALKRWRALMRLLSGPLGDQAEQMRLEARGLMHALTSARDAQSTLDALTDLHKAELPFSQKSIATIRGRITDLKRSAEQTEFTGLMRQRLTTYLDFAARSVDRWPFGSLDFDTIADAVTTTYRRARQLAPENWGEADAEHLHELRRRVVEHRHQMDVVNFLWPRLNQVWGEEAQRLRGRLGACQDLAVLASSVAPHGPLARWRSRLMPAIEARRAMHLKAAARLAGQLFAERPKAFRKRMGALYSAGQARRA